MAGEVILYCQKIIASDQSTIILSRKFDITLTQNRGAAMDRSKFSASMKNNNKQRGQLLSLSSMHHWLKARKARSIGVGAIRAL